MITRVDHIGVAVRDLEAAAAAFAAILGRPAERVEALPGMGVRIAFFPLAGGEIELVEGTDPAGSIARFLAARGEGIHHLCCEVEDLQAAIDRLHAAGVPMVDRVPRDGGGGTRVAFLHPKGTGGALLELCERPREGQGRP